MLNFFFVSKLVKFGLDLDLLVKNIEDIVSGFVSNSTGDKSGGFEFLIDYTVFQRRRCYYINFIFGHVRQFRYDEITENLKS